MVVSVSVFGFISFWISLPLRHTDVAPRARDVLTPPCRAADRRRSRRRPQRSRVVQTQYSKGVRGCKAYNHAPLNYYDRTCGGIGRGRTTSKPQRFMNQRTTAV
eukprot:6177515-Pleurochrysis_carterae.AAC.1